MIIISNDYQVPFEIFSQAGLIAVPAIIVMLLIPIVLFIMNKPNLYSFDKNILLDDIFMCKFLLPSIIIVSGLLCFSSSITFILPFQLLGITILLFRALIILYKTNKWFRSAEETINDPILSAKTEITTYKQSLRIKYLENIKSYSEKEDVWIDTLNDENFSKKNQQGLIEIFIRDIKEIKREGEFSDDLESLLLLLNNNFDKINLDSKLFKKLAEYSINYYDDLQKYEENQKYFPHSNQKKIFIKLLKKAITEGRFFRGIFFNVVAEFAKKQGDMRDFFIKDFFDDLLNFLKDGDYNYKEIWKNEFLKSNVISFKDGKLSSEVLLEIYREHISCALSDNLSEQKISFVNNITECLLPNIIPLLWFDVYTFNPSDALEENFKSLYDIIKQWCEKDREFGNSGKGYLGEGKKPQWEKETALLILDVYPKLTKKNIKRIIRTIKQMINDKVFKDNSREQKKLLWLKDRDFEIIQKYTGE